MKNKPDKNGNITDDKRKPDVTAKVKVLLPTVVLALPRWRT